MATISLNSDWLRLVEMQCDIITGEYSAFLEFDTINGEATRITVPRQLGSAPPKVLTEMIRRGARVPSDTKLAATLIGDLLLGQSAPIKSVTSRAGWNGSAYVLADTVLGPNPLELRFEARDSSTALAPVSGNLDQWKAVHKDALQASSVLTVIALAGLAAPLLGMSGRPSLGLLYLTEGTPTERMIALTFASAIGGRPATAGHMPPQALVTRTADSLKPFADQLVTVATRQADLDPKTRKRAIEQLAVALGSGTLPGGHPVVVVAADVHNVEAASETHLSELYSVRLSGSKGLFDRQTGPKARAKLLGATQVAVESHYGHPLRAFVHTLTQDAAALSKVDDIAAMFQAKAKAICGEQETAFVTALGILVAAGHLAVEYGVLPVTTSHVDRCAMRILGRALKRLRSPAQNAAFALSRLAGHCRCDEKFPIIEEGEAFPADKKDTAWGFRREIKGVQTLVLFHHRLSELIDEADQSMFCKEWFEAGALQRGKEATRWVRQVKISGFSTARPYGMFFNYRTLRGLMSKKATTTGPDSEGEGGAHLNMGGEGRAKPRSQKPTASASGSVAPTARRASR